ncbi:MAG: DNA mismatch repair endonuclease MutL [candidate division KSB1 bacterium]|nr:DNA mismatch repair endonuclease MutL [candidate division KSB1 bacterium]MDZ7346002.1 DNA mismatch repair endonuclease MutL [candidate division KSB1 bacterium]
MPNQTIQILPEIVVNKIAAGEVIDRPSSVVKELVENAIDAGATSITVLLKDGGKSLIQVVDNGVGMSEEDAVLSFQRHATSKIRDIHDVERVQTLGFRGEALASIAAVSRVEMKTIPQGQYEGTVVQIAGGVIHSVGKIGGNPGTSIAVKNLFFNTPARRKFLRADSTEYRHILTMMNRFTLAYPDIEFTLYHQDHQVYHLAKSDARTRIVEVLGVLGENFLEVTDENALFELRGFIGNKEALRKTRDDQYLFVNRRWINDRILSSAVAAGYGEILPKDRFPTYVLFFTIDQERIDVNVHPTKSEIKFADQQALFPLVRSAVRRALFKEEAVPDIRPTTSNTWRKSGRLGFSPLEELRSTLSQQRTIDFDAGQAFYAPPNPESKTAATPEAEASEKGKFWQIHNQYILSEIKSGLVIVDQHAAHERIYYERVKSALRNRNAASQQLLFPHTIDLPAEDYELLLEILPFLERMGFVIKGFGSRTVVLEGIPADLRIRAEEKILPEILDEYKLNQTTETDVQERVAKSVACRAAVMSGDKLSEKEMNALIDQLFACETPYFCPHGRPTMITLTLEELDRRFERT